MYVDVVVGFWCVLEVVVFEVGFRIVEVCVLGDEIGVDLYV